MSESNKPKTTEKLIVSGIAIAMLLTCAWFGVEWFYNRIYVYEGTSVLLNYKGPNIPIFLGDLPSAEQGTFAEVDENNNPKQKGIIEQMLGPGRHFYCPIWWKTELVPDIVINEGEVGLVNSKMGKQLQKGEFLVDGDIGSTEFKGILRKVLIPGRYRINPYAYSVKIVTAKEGKIKSGEQEKHVGWVNIPTGYVGVVTNLAENRRTKATVGIQKKVLAPGIYPINEREQHVDIVEIGYREHSIKAKLMLEANGQLKLDESGEPVPVKGEEGITFPSNDGFDISMDFTAVWGILPENAPNLISEFGNIEAVENKVVLPQIKSICINMGSKMGAEELLVGESRKLFQEDISNTFKSVLKEKEISLLYGLVRHIYIPQTVRTPIQNKSIADEVKLTINEKIITKEKEGDLNKAKADVELAGEEVTAETEVKIAEIKANGEKEAEEIRAQTIKMIAEIDKNIADLEAQATIMLGQADAEKEKMAEEAKAQRFKLAVAAFGSGQAFNQWVFASGLPDDMKLNMLYAGEGTFWTDLNKFSDVLLGRQVQKSGTSSRSQVPAKKIPRPSKNVKRK